MEAEPQGLLINASVSRRLTAMCGGGAAGAVEAPSVSFDSELPEKERPDISITGDGSAR